MNVLKILVDDDKLYLLSKYHWYTPKTNRNTIYAMAYIDRKIVLLHRLIMGAKPGQIVDHINGNGLDNRRSNLRFASRSQNKANTSKYKNNTSGYKGVIYDKDRNCWRAQISINGKCKKLTRHRDIIDAAKAYDDKAKEVFGEYAKTNF